MHYRRKLRDAKQAKKERCKIGQKRETQDMPKVRDAVQAKSESCKTGQSERCITAQMC